VHKGAFVRVRYDAALLTKIAAAVRAQTISNIDRWGVVADQHAFAAAGQISAAEVMTFLASAFAEEPDVTVWCAIINFESSIKELLQGQDEAVRAKFNAWCRALYGGIFRKLGPIPAEGGNHRDNTLRAFLLGRLTSADDADAVAMCHAYFDNRATTPIPADLRNAVYATIVKTRGAAGWEAVVAVYDSTTEAMEKARCLRSLAAAKDAALLKRTMDFAMSDKVRAQDAFWVILGVAANQSNGGGALFLSLVKTQWATLWEKFPGMILGHVVKGIGAFADPAVADDFAAFFDTIDAKQKASVNMSLQQGLEEAKHKAAWIARDLAAIVKALE